MCYKIWYSRNIWNRVRRKNKANELHIIRLWSFLTTKSKLQAICFLTWPSSASLCYWKSNSSNPIIEACCNCLWLQNSTNIYMWKETNLELILLETAKKGNLFDGKIFFAHNIKIKSTRMRVPSLYPSEPIERSFTFSLQNSEEVLHNQVQMNWMPRWIFLQESSAFIWATNHISAFCVTFWGLSTK